MYTKIIFDKKEAKKTKWEAHLLGVFCSLFRHHHKDDLRTELAWITKLHHAHSLVKRKDMTGASDNRIFVPYVRVSQKYLKTPKEREQPPFCLFLLKL